MPYINQILGNIYFMKSQHAKSEAYYLQCIMELKEYNNLADVYNNLGEMYETQGRYIESLIYYSKCLEAINHFEPPKPFIARVHYAIGLVNLYLEDFDQSEEFFLRTLDIFEEITSKEYEDIVQLYFYLGYLYKIVQSYEQSLKYYFSGLQIGVQYLDRNNLKIALIIAEIGTVYTINGNFKDGENFLLDHISILQENEYAKNELKISYEQLESIYKSLNNHDQEIYYAGLIKELNN